MIGLSLGHVRLYIPIVVLASNFVILYYLGIVNQCESPFNCSMIIEMWLSLGGINIRRTPDVDF